ncbi:MULTISPECIES: BCCT family transporter [unclassified Modestobacter]|uniref:BCCT family transporter n=1 Tax=unclassified Modestobacter TaxID=2643866 RepID=UPI0022AB2223|nr:MULTISPECIES: BCCT family transporter [unclassified Modestobacter]MCZ2823259.1 BCCT family transporter [Modestobacter sp. VKM Ac-2981]MCZ2851504.1 BCCT family transporter [Modestobacter sp. VKM Ac-2982]
MTKPSNDPPGQPLPGSTSAAVTPGHDETAAPDATPSEQTIDDVLDPDVPSETHPAIAQPPTQEHDRRPRLDRTVFGVAAVISLAFLAWGFLSPTGLGSASGSALGWIEGNLGWFFVLLASAVVIFVLWIAASAYGRIPLGADGERPEFRTISWIAMMFSAGMGIGLMFFGVAEPLSHYVSPPPGTVPGETDEAVTTALATTLFHWTLHPWALYALVGLAVAYGTYRRGRGQLLSSAFTSLFGRGVAEGPAGKVIDVLAIFATLFGTAASLGLGALQIGSGLEILGWLGPVGNAATVGIIAVLTAAFVASAFSGIARGIQWLSNINVVLAFVLALFVFVVGPTVFILNLVPTALGSYLADLPELAARTNASGGDAVAEWLSGWTVFYWAWWISWTPFVGVFLARISRGRTIREFITGVLLVPSVVTLFWFAVFGGAGIAAQRSGQDLAGQATPEGQLFGLLQELPVPTITSVIVMLLVGIFFVTGADSASIVMASLSERGTREPTSKMVVFWGLLTGGVAAVMLLVGGDEALQGLRNLTIIAALPFAVVMIGLAVALTKDLRSDPMVLRRTYASEAVEQAVVDGITRHGDDFELVVRQSPDGHTEAHPEPTRPTEPTPPTQPTQR